MLSFKTPTTPSRQRENGFSAPNFDSGRRCMEGCRFVSRASQGSSHPIKRQFNDNNSEGYRYLSFELERRITWCHLKSVVTMFPVTQRAPYEETNATLRKMKYLRKSKRTNLPAVKTLFCSLKCPSITRHQGRHRLPLLF